MGSALDPMDLRPGDILEGDCFPEPVRVLQVQVWDNLFRLEAVGLRTREYYDRVLSVQDLGSLRRFRASVGRDFRGQAEGFFLAVEGHRIRFAQQFDPLFAVNVSQIDPLPHQIERSTSTSSATRGCAFCSPTIRGRARPSWRGFCSRS